MREREAVFWRAEGIYRIAKLAGALAEGASLSAESAERWTTKADADLLNTE